MTQLRLLRVHLPDQVVERVDELAAELADESGRKPPRAAVMRVLLLRDLTGEVDIKTLPRNDPVKRGRQRVQLPLPFKPGDVA